MKTLKLVLFVFLLMLVSANWTSADSSKEHGRQAAKNVISYAYNMGAMVESISDCDWVENYVREEYSHVMPASANSLSDLAKKVCIWGHNDKIKGEYNLQKILDLVDDK